MLKKRETEARQIVTLEQVRRRKDTTSEIGDVETDEGVGLSGVAAKLQRVGVGRVADADIYEDVRSGVLVGGWAAIPAIRHALLATIPFETARLATDAEEGLEVVAVEVPAWFLHSVVGHEVDDEVVSSRDDHDSRESTGEVVWVAFNGFLLNRLEARSEFVQCVAIFGSTKSVDLFELGDVQGVSISLTKIDVISSDGRVTLQYNQPEYKKA